MHLSRNCDFSIQTSAFSLFFNGQIVDSGTHLELIRQGGYYAGLVELQTQGLIANEVDETPEFAVI